MQIWTFDLTFDFLKWFSKSLDLPTSRFQITLGFGEPVAKHGIANEFPEMTSISFGGFLIQVGGTTMMSMFE